MNILPLELSASILADAIEKRHSSRTFNGLRLDSSSIAKINEAIERLTPLFPDVPQPIIRLVDAGDVSGKLGTYGFINGARQFLVMAVGDTEAEKIQAGYMFEQLILAATAAGLDTCWLGGTFRRSIFEKALGDTPGRELCIVSPIGHATQQRRFAERMIRSVARSGHRHSFSKLFPGIDPASPAGALLEAVRIAPSSSNSQPWRATNNSAEITFTSATNNRFTPFDMGIAYAHFVIAASAAGIHVSFDGSAPSLSLTFRVG